MTFRAPSTGRMPAILQPTIAAGDSLIREVRAGKWPRVQPSHGTRDEAPLPTLRELRQIVSPDDGKGLPLRPVAGVPPPRPEVQHDPAVPAPTGGADQGVDPFEIPPGLRRRR